MSVLTTLLVPPILRRLASERGVDPAAAA